MKEEGKKEEEKIENPMKVELAAKVAKYEKEAEMYRMTGQAETAAKVEAEAANLKREMLRY